MKIAFLYAEKPRERLLADALIDGLDDRDEGIKSLNSDLIPDCDVACMVGVKSREIFKECIRRDIRVLIFDKGYIRRTGKGPIKCWEYWRVSLNAHHPTTYLKETLPSDRLEKLNIEFKPWRKSGKHILIAGSSAKYHDFYGTRPPNMFYGQMVTDIRKYTERRIMYRPKPSYKDAKMIPGTVWSSHPHIEEPLRKAWCLVTHGSNACFESVLHGIPCIITGDAVGKVISSHYLKDIEDPYLASEAERVQWLSNLAYWQWTLPEIASGEFWQFMRPRIYGL